MVDMQTLWSYRGFILASVGRDFRARYRNSLLGCVWAVLAPLAMILVYTLIFSQVMHSRLPGVASAYGYSIYLCAGILTWNLFSDILTGCTSMFVDHANLLKKLSFPWMCLPWIVLLTAFLNFAVGFLLFMGFLVITGNFPGWIVVDLLPLLALEIVFAISIGVPLGVANVFFRDVGHLLRIGLQFWFWLTPIVYTLSLLPESFQPLILMNPMTTLIVAFQTVLVQGLAPDWSLLWPLVFFTLGLFFMAGIFYRRLSVELVDEL